MRHDKSKAYLDSLKTEFGERLGYDLGVLTFEWWEAKRLYRLYQDLFGDPRHRSLISSSWDGLAGDLQTLIHDSFVLTICRLTDKKKPTKNSFESLTLESLEEQASEERKSQFQELFKKARISSEFVRIWRDKEIAHNDRKYFDGPTSLDVLSRDQVMRCFDSVGECLKFFDPTILDDPIHLGYDADVHRYMRILELGLAAEHGSSKLI